MQLKTHDRYDYVPLRGRADYRWPNGRRLAVYFALNLEHFSYGEGLGAELAPGGPQPDVLNFAWRDYGNRVGAWYMLDAFDALQLPLAALVNSAMYDYAPELVAACRARGDEVVGHGRTNAERQGHLDEAAERALIGEATARLTEGEAAVRKAGWGHGFRTAIARPTCWPKRATATSLTGAWTTSRYGSVVAVGARSWRCPIRRK